MATVSWFGRFDTAKPLEQGVILFDFEYLDIPSINQQVLDEEGEATKVTSDVIILTQSCDLVNEKVQHIHICPLYTLTEVFHQLEKTTPPAQKGLYEEFRKGQRIEKYMTDVFDIKKFGPKNYQDYLLVAFNQAVIASNSYITEFAKRRKWRPILKPPYREAMAQAYGRYFMRVGNPVDIRKFDVASYS